MRDLHRLRSEAEILAAELPDFQALTKERVTAQPGGAPRQRAGHGEDFWQYRSQSPEDSASAIDWRRSATGDDFYIREHELQSARLLEIGMDGSEGFDWSGDAKRFSKADEARVILTSIALRFAEDGDRQCGRDFPTRRNAVFRLAGGTDARGGHTVAASGSRPQ